MHEMDLLLTIGGGLGAALILGYITFRLGLSPIVGYLLAGIVVGPNTPGFVANAEIANQLAELGVILLMFGVGLHFDIHELFRVRHIAVPGALIQCAVSFAGGLIASLVFQWNLTSACVFGLALAFASTVVVTRVLADANELQTQVGSIAIGWLIVQDILAVLSLVLLPSIGQSESFSLASVLAVLGTAALKICIVVASIILIGGTLVPRILRHISETKSRELFTLTILVLVLGIALASSQIFGISMALGAFLAGVLVGQSEFSLRAATDALPMRDAFAVLFFVSIGMLFDPSVFSQSQWMLCVTLTLVILVTPLLCLTVLLALGQPFRLALRVALSLGQIGEFSFIIANLARHLGLFPTDAMHILVTVSILSISCAPLLQRLVEPIISVMKKYPKLNAINVQRRPFSWHPAAQDGRIVEELDSLHKTVIVGFGPVGRTVAKLLATNGIAPTIIEMNYATVAEIREMGYGAVLGDANHPETLKRAGVKTSLSLILSASTIQGAEEIIRAAKELNPNIKIIVRSAYLRERSYLLRSGADTVFAGEGEVAMALAEYILRDLGATPEQIDRERDHLRSEIFTVRS